MDEVEKTMKGIIIGFIAGVIMFALFALIKFIDFRTCESNYSYQECLEMEE